MEHPSDGLILKIGKEVTEIIARQDSLEEIAIKLNEEKAGTEVEDGM